MDALEALKRQHLDLLENIDFRYHDFSSLDNRFHRLVNESSPNRFIDDFSDFIPSFPTTITSGTKLMRRSGIRQRSWSI